MTSRTTARLGLGTVAALALAVAACAAPDPALLHEVAHPRAWADHVGADRAVLALTGAALWLVACWVSVCLAVAVVVGARRSPESAAARATRAVLPGWLRRLVVTATGLGLALTPVAAGAATTPPPRPAAVTPAPGWPTDDPLPSAAWPAQPAARSTPAPQSKPVPRPATHHTAAPRPRPHPTPTPTPAPAPTGRADGTVVVRPGDTLWSIAAHHLGAPGTSGTSPQRVARSWPAWFAANRSVIGDDPDLIRPGEHLRVPTAPTPHEITQQGETR